MHSNKKKAFNHPMPEFHKKTFWDENKVPITLEKKENGGKKEKFLVSECIFQNSIFLKFHGQRWAHKNKEKKEYPAPFRF